jgi:hypothetical protein
VTVENQEMIKIPAFFVKHFTPNAGPYAGRPCWAISPAPRDGFHLHPALKNTAGDLDCVYVGAYLATEVTTGVYGSQPAKLPASGITHANFVSGIEALNTGDVAGFHMLRLYEWAALQWLFLAEFCTANTQTIWAPGAGTDMLQVNVDNPVNFVWRNLWGLWGYISQRVAGLSKQSSTHFILLEANDGSGDTVTTSFLSTTYVELGSKSGFPLSMYAGQGGRYDFSDIFFPNTFAETAEAATFPDSYKGRASTSDFGPQVGGGLNDDSGLFSLNLSALRTSATAGAGSRIAKYGEPKTYEAPAKAPDIDAYINRAAEVATITRPGNAIHAENPAGVLKIDLPQHTGEQVTTMVITLETVSDTGALTLKIPCRQSLTVWPGANLTGGCVGDASAYDSVYAITENNRHSLIVGPISGGFLYACIREVTIVNPEASYLDGEAWRLLVSGAINPPSADGVITIAG